MFYLAKFCRICVQSGIKLVNLETLDSDSIALGEKLKTCTNMVITRESLSKAICMQCVKKLRICYDFQHMCRQSDKILEGYLSELLSSSGKVTAHDFDNAELSVTVTPLSCSSNHWKRKRITKEERCSLLKKLLSAGGKIKRHNKFYRSHIITKSPDHEFKGGLRDIINFTSNYDFGYSIDKNHNVEATPLEKLTAFSNNFFTSELTNFNKTLLDIIDTHNETCDSDEDDMFDKLQAIEDEEPFVKIEEVVIEPDIKIKNEVEYEDENEDYAANFVETSYLDSNKEIKKENIEIFPLDEPQNLSNSNCLNFNVSLTAPQSSSVNMLGNFVETFSACKTFSKHSIRCRTRNSPYINPQLKEQFQKRCFKCTKCSRYFKSPGYLKAHLSKVHR